MKIDQFKALCDREWAQGCGDVQELYLTNDSLREFTTDVLVAGSTEPWLAPTVLSIDAEDIPAIRCGALMTDLLNPITRSPVKVEGGADEDRAQVHAIPEPRLVSCG